MGIGSGECGVSGGSCSGGGDGGGVWLYFIIHTSPMDNTCVSGPVTFVTINCHLHSFQFLQLVVPKLAYIHITVVNICCCFCIAAQYIGMGFKGLLCFIFGKLVQKYWNRL